MPRTLVEIKPEFIFGNLTVVSQASSSLKGGARWWCKCNCGGACLVTSDYLRHSKQANCGCIRNVQRKEASLKQLVGEKFGKLTVLKRVENDKWGNASWLCKCDCGNTIILAGKQLRKNDWRDCGCVRNSVLIGNIYGRLVVIEFAGFKNKGSTGQQRQRVWKCKCECGKILVVAQNNLVSSITASCGCIKQASLGHKNRLRALQEGRVSDSVLIQDLINQIKRNARIRGYEFELTLDQVKEIIKQNCLYCNAPPSNILRGIYIYNGIDRIDNFKGYTITNSVPCCAICNKAKLDTPLKDFILWIDKVYNTMLPYIKRLKVNGN